MHDVFDQIALSRHYKTYAMQQLRLLHKELPFVYKTRLNCLMEVCAAATTSNKLFLTGLGRNISSATKTSSNIEKVNRLLGNDHLQSEPRCVLNYQYNKKR